MSNGEGNSQRKSAAKRVAARKWSEAESDPLKRLVVIQRLEVGPVRVEPQRITTPYTVIQKGKRSSSELIYRFEEDVFTPGVPSSVNLASMISAQVALNYGLFCEHLVFHGRFDRHDRRFIEEMARNTAREIFVKKFLEPNPFLTGPAAELPPVKLDNYLRARVLFSDDRTTDESTAPKEGNDEKKWRLDVNRHVVLSSGGKDSLLSFGLLNELGREVHPVFINESGRHWFTALNAYRHCAEQYPETSRVWTNSDRLFSWMLKHLPFIRPDFANLRSDEYPIRLWTVAVFLFGALPLLRKRRIGRLVIGDEFDTTRRLSHQGITHYDGLYDQSRYFDNHLTRYFHRKGWGVSQFSLLRPLSELLIQMILAKRYPDLHRHQVSCHAAHKEEGRIRPCGRCEKCRRIVGMLKAMDMDPGLCGYSPEQIERSLEMLADRGVHQESEGAQHLAFLLEKKGLIPATSPAVRHARERSEIMKLRIDPERSPPEGVPRDIREPVFRRLMEHANGAVLRNGRAWMDVDPFADPSMSRPYPFESPDAGRPSTSESKAPDPLKPSYLLGSLTWPEAKKRLKEVDVALLPVGSVEQHGPHLPLDTDAFDAEYLACEVAKACRDPKPLVLPLIPYGVSYHHEGFSGTVSVTPETLSRMVHEIGMGAARQGINKLVIINGHGGNGPALHFAAQMINRDTHIFTTVDTGESSDADINRLVETPNDVHAGEIETSTALAVRPKWVDLGSVKKFVPRFSIRYMNFSSKRSVGWYAHVARISTSGVMGDPTKASEEKGRRIWEVMIQNLVEFVEDLKSMSLDEIYQKRY